MDIKTSNRETQGTRKYAHRRSRKSRTQGEGGQVEKQGEWTGGGGDMGRESRVETNTVNIYEERRQEVSHHKGTRFQITGFQTLGPPYIIMLFQD